MHLSMRTLYFQITFKSLCLKVRQSTTLHVSADHAAGHVPVNPHMPVQISRLRKSVNKKYI